MFAKSYLVRLHDDSSGCELDQYELGATVTLGRDDSCDVKCSFVSVSREHCTISHVKGSTNDFEVEDLRSTHGTWVNKKRLGNERCRLKHGDVIGLCRGDNAPVFKFVVLKSVEDFRDNVLGKYHRKRKHPSDHVETLTENLWSSRKFCDSEINCRGGAFQVHRAILAAASPVFEAMFRTEMKEGLQCEVSLEAHAPDAVEAMLQYIYTGQMRGTYNAEEVLALADEYEMASLAEHCAAELLQGMTPANAIHTVRTVRQFKDRPHLSLIWTGICNSFRVLLTDDGIFNECIDRL